jgi:hypothetical protein
LRYVVYSALIRIVISVWYRCWYAVEFSDFSSVSFMSFGDGHAVLPRICLYHLFSRSHAPLVLCFSISFSMSFPAFSDRCFLSLLILFQILLLSSSSLLVSGVTCLRNEALWSMSFHVSAETQFGGCVRQCVSFFVILVGVDVDGSVIRCCCDLYPFLND